MHTNVNEYEFKRWFETNRPTNFSWTGLSALFEYLEEYEADTGEEIEFDPIALCCEYTEYDNIKEFHENYLDEETYSDLDAIRDYTQVIEVGLEGFIIQDF